jgi:hypothetical protein
MRSGWYMGNLFLLSKKNSSRIELQYQLRVLYEIRLVYGKPFPIIKKRSRVEKNYDTSRECYMRSGWYVGNLFIV